MTNNITSIFSSKLPISIEVTKVLAEQYSSLNSVINKLEAQVNFQTMTAGWYGDENNIITIKLFLESVSTFSDQLARDLSGQRIDFADDVVCFLHQESHMVYGYVALTDVELALINQHPKVLASFMDKKLNKVLHLIAQTLTLPAF